MDPWKINLTEIGKRRRFSEGKLSSSIFYYKIQIDISFYNFSAQIFHIWKPCAGVPVHFWRSVLRDLMEQACMFEEADIGKNIKSLRVARNLTLEALANRTGTPKVIYPKSRTRKNHLPFQP